MAGEGDQRATRRALAVGTLAMFALHLALSAGISGPWVVPDEAGYLGNARWLLGNHNWPMPAGPKYSAGYSVILIPAFAVLRDPDWQWRAAMVLNAALGALLFPVLHRLLTRVVGVAARPALAAAAIGALAPAALASGYTASPQSLTLLLVPLAVLAVAAMVTPDAAGWTRIAYGPIAAWLWWAHPRFTLALGVAVIIIVTAVVTRATSRRAGLANLAGLGVVTIVGWSIDRYLTTSRWAAVERPEGGIGEWIDLATSPSGIRELAITAAGQAWYLLAGSFGLAAIGLGVAVAALRRSDRPAAMPAPDDTGPARRWALAQVLASATSVFATSVLFFAQNQSRLDHYVYGRHNDVYVPLWLGLAVAYLLVEPSRARKLRALGAGALALAATGLVLTLTRDPMDFGGLVSSFSVPAVLWLLQVDIAHAFAAATILSLLGVGLLMLVVAAASLPPGRVRPASISAVLLVAMLGLASLGEGRTGSAGADGYDHVLRAGWRGAEDLDRLDVDQVSIDAFAAGSRPFLIYPWALPDVTFEPYDPRVGDAPTDVTLTLLDNPERNAAGDRIALLDTGLAYQWRDAPQGLALFIANGPTQDRLRSSGALLPPGFPAELPDAAQRAKVSIVDRPSAPVRVASGERVGFDVSIEHRGTGSPWPDYASTSDPARVRVLAEVTPVDPEGVAGARSGGELPRWMLPGDQVDGSIEIVALDQFLTPLAPGRYRVQLGVGQEGEAWFAPGGADAAFDLEVTPRR